jgi:hypothetical protein
VIYVPRYDPEVVYVQPYEPYLGPALTFGVGFAVGSWLNYDCDWPGRRVCVGDWNPGWRNDWNPGWRNDWNPGWRNDWNPRWKHEWKGNRGGDTINVVTINGDTARIWQPSAKVQRKQWQRERNYDNNATAYYNVNARGRRGDGNDQGRRFAAVARPSRLDFNGRAGDGDRAWRRSNSDESNLARNLPGEVRDPRTFRDQPPGQSDQLSRGDGNREWKGKGRGKENDSSQQFKTGRSKASHSQGTTPSYSKANKHSQSARVERSKGGSQTSGASYSKANKHSQSARVERSRGGSQTSGASYSTPNKSQSAGATGKGSGGGGHKSGKKGSSNKGDKGKG